MHPDWTPSIAPLRILGLTLVEPVTLGHVYVLAEADNPIVVGGDVLPGDIAQAVFVCSWPYAKSRNLLRSVMAPLAFKGWSWMLGSVDWVQAQDEFCKWFAEQTATPNRIITLSGGGQRREVAAPWWINRIAMAMGELGLSHEEAMSLPARHVAQLSAALLEARNQAEYESEERREYVTRMRELMSGKVAG